MVSLVGAVERAGVGSALLVAVSFLFSRVADIGSGLSLFYLGFFLASAGLDARRRTGVNGSGGRSMLQSSTSLGSCCNEVKAIVQQNFSVVCLERFGGLHDSCFQFLFADHFFC